MRQAHFRKESERYEIALQWSLGRAAPQRRVGADGGSSGEGGRRSVSAPEIGE